MTNNNENEAVGTDEISEEVANKIGVEMALWREKTMTVHIRNQLVQEEYIIQLEKKIEAINGILLNQISTIDLYRTAEDIVHDRAMEETTEWVTLYGVGSQ